VASRLLEGSTATLEVCSVALADLAEIPRADQAANFANRRRESPLKSITSLVVERDGLYW
jgi:hypothetical protein